MMEVGELRAIWQLGGAFCPNALGIFFFAGNFQEMLFQRGSLPEFPGSDSKIKNGAEQACGDFIGRISALAAGILFWKV